MYEFWYDYVKPKYVEKAESCYMGTDSLYGYRCQYSEYAITHKMSRWWK